MPLTRRQRRPEDCAACNGVTDAIALVCERLPPGEQFVTISRLSHAWRLWAAAKARALPHGPAADRLGTHCLPLWCLQEAWPTLSPARRLRALECAQRHGDVAALAWARREGGAPPGFWEEVCARAADDGHLPVLQWARRQEPPCPWDERVCKAAAARCDLAMLQWARRQKPPCPWNEDVCFIAARDGHLPVLQWARQQKPPCPWDEFVCEAAAEWGHLHVLQWARSQEPPCPWDEDVCYAAARADHLHVLQWARQQDPPCPWHRDECLDVALYCVHEHVVDWIHAAPQ
ncbi:MAG: hypothetical protein J3K34DRAFT_394761 [Monoraphidium minutum]|nr:MAG: hypothetical protein J3K34DRAFT_394761 [Monoraphidium minutum]